MTPEEVAKRLEQLEADNRRLRKRLWVVGIVAGLALLATLLEQRLEFSLFDYPWKYRTMKSSEGSDASRVSFYPPSMKGDYTHGEIVARPEYMWFQFEKARNSATLTAEEKRSSLELKSPGAKLVLASGNNMAVLHFCDSDDKIRFALGIIDNQPALVIYDTQGNVVSSLPTKEVRP
jgi:hypothetical protein